MLSPLWFHTVAALPWVPSGLGFSKPHSWSGHCSKDKILLLVLGQRLFSHPAHSLDTIPSKWKHRMTNYYVMFVTREPDWTSCLPGMLNVWCSAGNFCIWAISNAIHRRKTYNKWNLKPGLVSSFLAHFSKMKQYVTCLHKLTAQVFKIAEAFCLGFGRLRVNDIFPF
jgi:hypothetical protein